jgi:hypothetical protein
MCAAKQWKKQPKVPSKTCNSGCCKVLAYFGLYKWAVQSIVGRMEPNMNNESNNTEVSRVSRPSAAPEHWGLQQD